MSERGWFSYYWKEHLHPYFVAIPLLPFVILAGLLNRQLRRVPERGVPVVKLILQILFGLALALCLATGILSLSDYFGWFRFGLLHSVSSRPIAELLLLWLAGGMFSFYTFITHG